MITLISNQAALVAQSRLDDANTDLQGSVRRLSSGQRVTRASDDAASLAISTRLRTESLSLDQARTNAVQAASSVTIVEQMLARVQDTLTRARVLAVQSGSSNLSDSERALLDVEYQLLIGEVDRLASDTRLNGLQPFPGTPDPGDFLDDATNTPPGTAGFVSATVTGIDGRDVNEGGDGQFRIVIREFLNTTTNAPTFIVNLIFFDKAVQERFVFRTDFSNRADLAAQTETNAAGLELTNAIRFDMDFLRFRVDTTNTTDPNDTTFTEYSLNNVQVTLLLEETFNLNNPAATSFFARNDRYSLGRDFEDLTFKVGSGILDSEDNISFRLRGLDTRWLGLAETNLATRERSDATVLALDAALETIVEQRAQFGALINRFSGVDATLAQAKQNLEAARSELQDLDVAAEVTRLANQQVRVQAGISTAAQAGDLQRGLLNLLA